MRRTVFMLSVLLALVILGLPSFAAAPPTTPAPMAPLNLPSLSAPAAVASPQSGDFSLGGRRASGRLDC
jgi:hypothetical protein